MHKFARNLITEWRRLGLPTSKATVVVAVSGGADSMGLLLALAELTRRKKLSLQIVVAHFNHKLRGKESDGDEAFVHDTADRLELEFISGTGRVRERGNLEQNARNARYKFLADTAESAEAGIVLTGHTKNDQAETFLMNLIRGSGVDGLAGMRPTRDLAADIRLVRPLLSWASRSDTVGFCDELGVEYRTDRMNDDPNFTRVRVRQTVIPMLAEINPKIVDTLARTSDLLQAETPDIEPGPDRSELVVSDLKSLSGRQLYSTLRLWLRSRRGDLRALELKHIQAIERLILSPKSGKTVEIPGGGRVVKGRGRLSFSNIKVEK